MADTLTAPPPEAPPSDAPAPPPRPRLEFLDGLRGLAALYVVLFHVRNCVMTTGNDGGAGKWAYYGSLWLGLGRYAVAVFIVLSGYVLMLPVITSGGGRLRGGFWDYTRRRARRILPPYYAVLAIATLVNFAVIARYGLHNIASHQIRPAVTWGDTISHLLLIHNVSPDWAYKIDYPMWSVATEWQIYFFFPLLLLPLWRWAGLLVTVAASFALGLGLFYALPHAMASACPWFLGLFAFGMAGACLSFSPEPRLRALRDRAPWSALTALSGLLFVATVGVSAVWGGAGWLRGDGRWTLDALVGLWTLCLIVACARRRADSPEGGGPVLRLLESRPVVGLGAMSYSLYLIHALVLGVVHLAMLELKTPPLWVFLGLLVVGTPLSVLVSYGFYQGFERRFLPGHRRAEREAAR